MDTGGRPGGRRSGWSRGRIRNLLSVSAFPEFPYHFSAILCRPAGAEIQSQAILAILDGSSSGWGADKEPAAFSVPLTRLFPSGEITCRVILPPAADEQCS